MPRCHRSYINPLFICSNMPYLFPFSLLFLFFFPWLLTSICNTNCSATRTLPLFFFFFFSFSLQWLQRLLQTLQNDRVWPLCCVKRMNSIWYILNSLHINVENNPFHFGDFATWKLKLVFMHAHFRICVDYAEDNIAKFLSSEDEFPFATPFLSPYEIKLLLFLIFPVYWNFSRNKPIIP